MAFLVDERTRVVVQGATGRLGRMAIGFMQVAGSEVVAGVTPGRGGEVAVGVPIFDSVAAAVHEEGANASIAFVPSVLVLDAALEAVAAGVEILVVMVDGVPVDVTMAMLDAAAGTGTRIVGPNTAGIVSPGRSMLGALRTASFNPGRVSIVSRSGGMMSTIAATLTAAGIGQSTCIGVGGDTVIGTDVLDAVALAEDDPDTDAVCLFGEIGTDQEERLAAAVAAGRVTKPIAAYIAGVAAPPGRRYSHAGTMSEGGRGSAREKREALAAAGVQVVDRYTQLPGALVKMGVVR